MIGLGIGCTSISEIIFGHEPILQFITQNNTELIVTIKKDSKVYRQACDDTLTLYHLNGHLEDEIIRDVEILGHIIQGYYLDEVLIGPGHRDEGCDVKECIPLDSNTLSAQLKSYRLVAQVPPPANYNELARAYNPNWSSDWRPETLNVVETYYAKGSTKVVLNYYRDDECSKLHQESMVIELLANTEEQ